MFPVPTHGLMGAMSGADISAGVALALDFINGATSLDPRITFSRTTNATLTDSTGKIAYAPHNLLTNSEDFEASAWVPSNTSVTANNATAPDGTLTADKLIANTTLGGHFTGQSVTTTAVAHTFSAYLKAAGYNWAVLYLGGPNVGIFFDLSNGTTGSTFIGAPTSSSITAVGNGWYRCSITATLSTSATPRIYIASADGPSAGFAGDNVSGLFAWGAQLNVGALQSYNSTTPKNLLGFTQEFNNAAWTKSNSFVQTNLVLWSEDFSNAAWIKSAGGTGSAPVVTANAATAPDGTTTADLILFNRGAGNTGSDQSGLSSSPSVASGTHTQSIWLKAATAGDVGKQLALRNVAGAVYLTVTLTADWVRYTRTETGAIANFEIANRGTFTADNSVSAHVWGAQLVQGSVPGDYQVTTSAAAAVQYSDPNGTRTADKLVEDAATAFHYAFQLATPSNSAPYTVSLYAKAAERTRLRISGSASSWASQSIAVFDLLNGTVVTNSGAFTSASIVSVGNGWYRCTATGLSNAAPTPSQEMVQIVLVSSGTTASYTGDGTSGIFIWGAQLSNSASVDPYVYNPQAAPTSTAYYGPRFDYNPVTLAANGLLIEQQSTNLLLWSEDFSNAVWVNNGGTVTSNALVAPDGTTTADYLVRSTASGDGRYQAISAGTSGVLTASIYIKKDTAVNSAIWIYDATAVADRAFATITWSGSTPTLTATVGTAGTPIDAGNGWWRISITSTALVGANTNRLYLLPAYTASSNGQQTAFWGAQLE